MDEILKSKMIFMNTTLHVLAKKFAVAQIVGKDSKTKPPEDTAILNVQASNV